MPQAAVWQDCNIDDVLPIQSFVKKIDSEEWPDIHVAWNKAQTMFMFCTSSGWLTLTSPLAVPYDLSDDALRRSRIRR